jgi:hypothetical protein
MQRLKKYEQFINTTPNLMKSLSRLMNYTETIIIILNNKQLIKTILIITHINDNIFF